MPGRTFALLAGVQCCLLLDILFDWRWKLHAYEINKATGWGVYEMRRMPQVIVLVLLSLALLLTAVWIMRKFHTRKGTGLAVIGTMLSAGLWLCEVISFHITDDLLYHPVGYIVVIGLVWICFAAVTCWGAWLDDRRLL